MANFCLENREKFKLPKKSKFFEDFAEKSKFFGEISRNIEIFRKFAWKINFFNPDPRLPDFKPD